MYQPKKGRKIASMRVVLLRNYLNGDVKITREVLQIQILNAQCKKISSMMFAFFTGKFYFDAMIVVVILQ